MTDAPPGRAVTGLIGVYDAVGSPRGELAYWIGARLGRTHCALCDVTHGLFAERADWRTARSGLPVPFESFHLDDQPPGVREAAGGKAPVVLARVGEGVVLLLGPDALGACNGSPARLIELLDGAVTAVGLRWPAVP